ncbi:MAG: hypothetical protein CFE44_20905, partial [Burkholderiales bacterium PBB4]
ARGNFACVLTGAPISEDWNRAEGKARRLGSRLMAVVAEGDRGRVYLSADEMHEKTALGAVPPWEPDGELAEKALGFRVPAYGLTRWADLFTPRQLVGLATYSALVEDVRNQVLMHAKNTASQQDGVALRDGGSGSVAYADAIATYLSFTINRMADLLNNLCQWRNDPAKQHVGHLFSRHAIPMTWDYAEANPFGNSAGSWKKCESFVPKCIEFYSARGFGRVTNINAPANNFDPSPTAISSDPPYYDNIGYADLSDFFYVWLRKSLSKVWPDLFRRISTPKEEELVATPFRHGGPTGAEAFFMEHMGKALGAMQRASIQEAPITIYYAFKQSELESEGITSAGWSSFLQAILNAGLSVDGTWPMRTELANRMRGLGSNALASSIVLVCRKRAADASVITRADFVRALKRELPDAIDDIRKAGVGPVDMQQSVIGPGMGVFSRHAKVLEDDDSAMPVKTALSVINRVWEEIDQELDANFDAETQVALAWYASYGDSERVSGDLITLANAKNIPSNSLFASGVFEDRKGKTALTKRVDLPKGWTPASDKSLTVWECVQHTARVLNAEDGGGAAAGRLVAEMGPKAAEARALAYRLFEIATQQGWAAEALIYNELAQEWPKLEDLASSARSQATTATAQAELF